MSQNNGKIRRAERKLRADERAAAHVCGTLVQNKDGLWLSVCRKDRPAYKR